MALKAGNRVRDTTTTTGTGAVTVSGTAPTGYRTFSAVLSVNDTFVGLIAHQSANEWEVGVYTYSSSNTVTRTTILASSNAGSAVNFSAGTKDVVLTESAERSVVSTDLQCPQVTGGDATSSTLILRSTSAAGSTDAVIVKTGNSVEGLRVDTNQDLILKNNTQNVTSAWTSWSPTVTSETGTLGGSSSACAYKQIGKTVMIRGEINVTSLGSGAGDLRFTLPVTAVNAVQIGGPWWNRSFGDVWGPMIPISSTQQALRFLGTDALTASVFGFSMTYEAA